MESSTEVGQLACWLALNSPLNTGHSRTSADGPNPSHSCNGVTTQHSCSAACNSGSPSTPIQPTQPHQPLRMLRLHLIPAKPPLPITFSHPRQVRAAAAIQPQHVLPMNASSSCDVEAQVVTHMLRVRCVVLQAITPATALKAAGKASSARCSSRGLYFARQVLRRTVVFQGLA